jgi:DNA-binding CsgD family transcriptional regulator
MSELGRQAATGVSTEGPAQQAMDGCYELICECVDSYSNSYNLSPQERRVLLAAVQGVADKLVADDLGVSRSTISTYWKRIFGKTQCRSQRDVLAHLLRTLAAVPKN